MPVIIKETMVTNMFHAFANLTEAIDDLSGDKSPSPSTSLADNDEVLERRRD